jgi:hypothetical protein
MVKLYGKEVIVFKIQTDKIMGLYPITRFCFGDGLPHHFKTPGRPYRSKIYPRRRNGYVKVDIGFVDISKLYERMLKYA